MRSTRRRNCLTVAAAASLSFAALAPARVFHNYESLNEGFLGQTLVHNGVTYRDVNRVNGSYPDGVPFDDDDNGNEVIVERATFFYNDFPTYGSPVNALTFGSSFVPGDNLTIGALASVWMDLSEPGNTASLDVAFYENGPWGGIQWKLEAVRNGQVVASDSYTFSDLGGRDNAAFQTLDVSGAEFDSLHLYGWLNGNYTAPRGMIDDLSITSVPEPTSSGAIMLGALGLAARRRRSR